MEPERTFFKTDMFDIEEGEDSETNPEIYGKQFASWIKLKLSNLGYEVEDIIPEDWGWCVMCERNDGMLWVGCASYIDGEVEKGHQPGKEDIVWHCFATFEQSFLKRIFSNREGKTKLEKLKSELKAILHEEESFQIVNEPE
jgi:hypothetical protein